MVLKMSYIEVLLDSYSEETTVPDPTDEWDRASTQTSWTIEGLRLVEAAGYRVHEVPFKAEIGKRYFLVYAIYTTGDSFGCDDGRGFEILGIFDDRDLAEQAATAARGTGKFINEAGKMYDAYRPWDGFFERLDSLEVLPLVLS